MHHLKLNLLGETMHHFLNEELSEPIMYRSKLRNIYNKKKTKET